MKLKEGAYAKARLQWEREYWLKLIRQTEGNQRKAARLAGVSPSTMCRRMRECGFVVKITLTIEEMEELTDGEK